MLATPVDTTVHGTYRIVRGPDDPRPLYRFTGRITDDGPFTPDAGRYHVYAGWFCPFSQRVTIALALAGLTDAVSVSYVDNARDGRGWAFRERYGPDPVNGFALLRQAYEATEAGFDGHVSVPTLWDRATGRVVSNDFRTIGIDVATRFRALAEPLVDTYPEALREEIEALDDRPLPELEERLATREYLVGGTVTEADIRLWVKLVRAGDGLVRLPNLRDYERRLWDIPAFRDTTDVTTFPSFPSFAA